MMGILSWYLGISVYLSCLFYIYAVSNDDIDTPPVIRPGFDSRVRKHSHPYSIYVSIKELSNMAFLESFMNHTATIGNLTQYIDDMDTINAHNPNITFLLGETNSDYVNLNMSQIEGVFGSSLWLVDYLLYGLSIVSISINIFNKSPK
jgi:hypothetical protein